MGLIEGGIALISGADRVMEITAQNVANMTTPGYRARQAFWALIDPGLQEALPGIGVTSDFGHANLMTTSRNLDFAIQGEGFFVVRSGEQMLFTRDGQFNRDKDGRIVNAEGFALQSDAGDVVVKNLDCKVLSDGTILDGGEPVGRLKIVDFQKKSGLSAVGASSFRAASGEGVEVIDVKIAQGALEASNVSSAHETITMMQAVRQVEVGQRVVQIYDELLGRAITTFGGE